MTASPSPSTRVIEVFFSYAHADEALRNELAKHLSVLEHQKIIAGWHDRQIPAGSEWASAIDTHLHTAQIILLLVSADFLVSTYCYDLEMQHAMARHAAGDARVIPIILRPVDWHSAPFGALQALPKDGRPVTEWPNRDTAFLDITRGIRAVAEELIKGSGKPKKPPHGPESVEPPRSTSSTDLWKCDLADLPQGPMVRDVVFKDIPELLADRYLNGDYRAFIGEINQLLRDAAMVTHETPERFNLGRLPQNTTFRFFQELLYDAALNGPRALVATMRVLNTHQFQELASKEVQAIEQAIRRVIR